MTQSFRLPIRALTAIIFFPLLNVASPLAMADGNTGSSNGTEDRRTTGLEEITVTARRREEDLQSVPVAVTVVSQQTLQNNNIQVLEDLHYLVPSLMTSMHANREEAEVSIRG